MEKIGIGIFGTGKFAHRHAQAIGSLPGAELVAVCGSDERRVNEFALKYGIKGFLRSQDLLACRDIRIADIVTAHNRHADIAVEAICAGKDVIVEKPIASTLADAGRIVSVCRKNNRNVSVISQHRYDEAYARAKEAVSGGMLGKVLGANLSLNWQRGQSYYDACGGWIGRRKDSGGGVLMMQAVHLIDVACWILGEPVAVSGEARTITHDIEVEDTASASIDFRQGFSCQVFATTSSSLNLADRFAIHGTKGSLIIEDHQFMSLFKPASSKIQDYARRAAFKLFKNMPFKLQLRRRMKMGGIEAQIKDVLGAVSGGRSWPSPPEEAAKVLKCVLSVYESAQKGGEKVSLE